MPRADPTDDLRWLLFGFDQQLKGHETCLNYDNGVEVRGRAERIMQHLDVPVFQQLHPDVWLPAHQQLGE